MHVPVQLPLQVPEHWTEGAVAVASHSPLHEAVQDPEQFKTGAVTDPWHDPVQLAEQVPERLPGAQLAVTDGGVQLALPLQLPSQLASALTLTEQPPPETLSPHETLADAPPSSPPPAEPFRTAVIPADAALQAAVTWVSIEPPAPPSSPAEPEEAGIAAAVTPAFTRSFEMLVHAVRTACSIPVWIVCREVTADAKAVAFALPLHLLAPAFWTAATALHPFARTGIAKNDAMSTPDFKALILAMTSSLQ